MTARAKVILFIIIALFVLGILVIFGTGNDTPSVTDETPTTTPDVVMEDPGEIGNTTVGTTTTYFIEHMQAAVIANGGHPIEGFEPFMFMGTFPGLKATDFQDVEAELGVYRVTDGEVMYEETEAQLHSAAKAITQKGMETLLSNISQRLAMEVETKADVDALLVKLQAE